MALLASVSIGAVAEHHGGSDKGQDKAAGCLNSLTLMEMVPFRSEEHEAAIARMADERRERFKTMDADGDGSVSREEAAAARLQRKEGHRPRRQGRGLGLRAKSKAATL